MRYQGWSIHGKCIAPTCIQRIAEIPYQIRGEFMRASRILATRPERAIIALAQLCEERKDTELVTSPPPTIFVPPRLSPIPPQTPYTVRSKSGPKGLPSPEQVAAEPELVGTELKPPASHQVPIRTPEHMAPKRSEWTSPPPPEAPPADHTSFEDKLGLGLTLATSSTEAREREASYASSSSNSEIFSDDEPRSDIAESDDVRSVHSFTEGSSPSGPSFHRPPWHIDSDSTTRVGLAPPGYSAEVVGGLGSRGRFPAKLAGLQTRSPAHVREGCDVVATSRQNEANRRSSSGPSRAANRSSWPSMMPIALVTPLPPSPSGSASPVKSHSPESSTVFYETGSRHLLYSSPGHGLHANIFPYQQRQYHTGLVGAGSNNHSDNHLPLAVSRNAYLAETVSGRSSASSTAGPHTPTPTYYARPTHQHTYSNATITAPTPRANISQFAHNITNSSSPARSRSPSQSPSLANIPTNRRLLSERDGTHSPTASTSYGSDSPTPSSPSSAISLSSSPSPSSSNSDASQVPFTNPLEVPDRSPQSPEINNPSPKAVTVHSLDITPTGEHGR